MRSINAIRICITPFPEDDQCLAALEDELCQISNVLDRFEAEGELKDDVDRYVQDANEK